MTERAFYMTNMTHKTCICLVVTVLTNTPPLCTPRLQPKHFPNLQQRPGTAASTLLLRSRARQLRTSLRTSPEVHQVEDHRDHPQLLSLTASDLLYLLPGVKCLFVHLLLSVYRGQSCSFQQRGSADRFICRFNT